MADIPAPGIYVAEQRYALSPLRMDRRCLTGFVGITERGPLGEAVAVKSFDEYLAVFGGFDTPGVLPLSVYAYFKCGGSRCLIVRAANEKQARRARLRAACAKGGAIVFEALSEGVWGNHMTARIWHEKDASAEAASFSLSLSCKKQTETYLHLSPDPASERYYLSYINARSRLCTVREEKARGLPREKFLLAASGGGDGIAEISAGDFIGEYKGPGNYRGLGALESRDDISLIAAPDAMWLLEQPGFSPEEREGMVQAVQAALVNQAERFPGRFAVLDTPPRGDAAAALAWARRFDSASAALYYPSVDVIDPLDVSGVKTLRIPPSGAVCGAIAATDSEKGIFHAPANRILQGAAGVSVHTGDREYGLLYSGGVNLLRYFPGRGVKIWGARTLSPDPAWKYINVRRTFSRICDSIKKGTRWAVFEPNTKNLRKRLVRQVSGFLLDLWAQGCLAGSSAGQGFYVRCDEELNPPENADKGILVFETGLAITRPAEFFKIFITAEKDGASVYVEEGV